MPTKTDILNGQWCVCKINCWTVVSGYKRIYLDKDKMQGLKASFRCMARSLSLVRYWMSIFSSVDYWSHFNSWKSYGKWALLTFVTYKSGIRNEASKTAVIYFRVVMGVVNIFCDLLPGSNSSLHMCISGTNLAKILCTHNSNRTLFMLLALKNTNVLTNDTTDHGIQFRMCCILIKRTKAKIAFTEIWIYKMSLWRHGIVSIQLSSWRHQMETLSTLLALSDANLPVTGSFP